MKRFLILIALLGYAATANAGQLTYACKVESEYSLASDGSLSKIGKVYLGHDFHIERRTGTVSGGGLGNSAYPTKTVIDPGGPNTAFKLLYVSADVATTNKGKNAVYITVQEYSDSAKKPFVVVEGALVLTGQCE